MISDMTLLKRFSYFSLLVPVMVLGACSGPQEASREQQQSQAAPAATPRVQVSPVLQDQPAFTITLPGELKPFEQVSLYPKVKGFIKALYADRGSLVKKGQLLALLEAPEITQQYLSAQASSRKLYENMQYSRQAFNRLRQAAAKSGAVAAIELDKARSQYRSDSAAYAAAQASTRALAQMRTYLSVRAPFAGTVTERNVSVGALVGENAAPGTALFTLAQQGKLRLTVAVPEKHAAALQPGTPVTFTVNGRPGKTFTSTLSRQGLTVDPKQRSLTAEFDVSNADGTLHGGEYAQVQLQLRRPEPTTWVPVASVVRAQSGTFLLKVNQGRLQRVPLTEGIRRDTLQEVFGLLAPGDLVVNKGSEELPEDSPVQVIEAGAGKQKQGLAGKK